MNTHHYHIDEAAIRLPAGFRDSTINVFEWVEDTGSVVLTIQREEREDDTRFEELVARSTAPYPDLFSAYAEEEPMDLAMDVPAISRPFRTRNDHGVAYHHQVFLDLGSTILLLTAAGKAASRERIDELLQEALMSLQPREPWA